MITDSRALSELYKSPELWKQIVKTYGQTPAFKDDIGLLVAEGIVEMKFNDYSQCELTEHGKEVAEMAESKGRLFSQMTGEFWETSRIELRDAAD